MELTKQLEEEIIALMNDYWELYFRGDLEHWCNYIVDDYRNIGGTEEEIWNSKEEILAYSKRVVDQLVGVSEIRNKTIQIIPYDPYFMVHEFMEVFIKVEDQWEFYGKFRLSSLIQKINGRWKVLHQHGSYPDAHTEQGEAFAFDKLRKENTQLREAVQRRTVELESKNRELEIETSLEKVRAVAMGMMKPDDLLDICEVMFTELKRLGFDDLRNAMINIHYDDRSYLLNYDYAIRSGKTVTTFKYHSHPIVDNIVNHASQSKETFTEMIYSGDALDELRAFRKQNGEDDDARLDEVDALCYYFYATGNGALGISMYQTANEEQLNILKRFRNVFDLAYKRYTDISHAEAQAREAQVEAALEKVRSRSLAMHKSNELQEVVNTVFERLQSLNIEMNVASIFIFKEGSKDWQQWVASSDTHYSTHFHIPYTDNIIFRDLEDAKETHKDFYSACYSFEEKNDWFSYAFTNTEYSRIPDARKKFLLESPFYQVSFALAKNTGIQLAKYSGNDFTEQDKEILQRFSRVFEQAYTRFLDLQKAEAQSRESEIQLALERVRARTMAMHKSDELAAVASVLFFQLQELKLHNIRRCLIGIVDETNNKLQSWHTSLHGDTTHKVINYPLDEHPVIREKINGWKKQQPFRIDLTPGELKDFIQYIVAHGFEYNEGEIPATRLIQNHAPFKYGYIELATHETISAEDFQLLQRFAKVFEQTYTRFLDLQKAEAQAREAEVELALERVRARTMAMHKSDELKEVIRLVLAQLIHVGINAEHAGFYIDYKAQDDMHIWLADPNIEPFFASLPYFDTPTWNSFLEARAKGTSFHTDLLNFKEKNKFYTSLFKLFAVPEEAKQFYMQCKGLAVSTVLLDNVGLYIENFSAIPYTDEENKILMRFGKVFQQTYTRFLDLQKAEEQAREAQIEAALEKVRSKTLSMQHSDELADTSAVLFQQLIGLGISPNRLYIAILKDEQGEAEFWITDEDGAKVSMAYEDNLNNNPSFKQMLDGWEQQQKSLVIDMEGEVLQHYFQYLQSIHVPFHDGLEQKRRLQYLAYFSKGFIGMASPDEQPPETLRLLERFAYVFNLTFTRFHDLQLAEAHAIKAEQDLIEIKAARKNAETALAELQATQKQLIQSEKMASLGELTAGIAHEIQNPLNFVNNFSEVSGELLDEIMEEVEKGNYEEVKLIVEDVKQNLEKINHHGKRADGIVKGMLQHSRTSTGQKEQTNINTLCDEYLRLAYHGLRAKDKTFNAELKTDFDDTVGKLAIVPQEIGRVLLNLVNNAFYAVNERRKTEGEGFKPLVEVSTKNLDDTIEIAVKDNGAGIPDQIKEKIFQPFFTTKPTGQGTGLGLSLSYDIVKAHGGELKVHTMEEEGSTFIIVLPFS